MLRKHTGPGLYYYFCFNVVRCFALSLVTLDLLLSSKAHPVYGIGIVTRLSLPNNCWSRTHAAVRFRLRLTTGAL